MARLDAKRQMSWVTALAIVLAVIPLAVLIGAVSTFILITVATAIAATLLDGKPQDKCLAAVQGVGTSRRGGT